MRWWWIYFLFSRATYLRIMTDYTTNSFCLCDFLSVSSYFILLALLNVSFRITVFVCLHVASAPAATWTPYLCVVILYPLCYVVVWALSVFAIVTRHLSLERSHCIQTHIFVTYFLCSVSTVNIVACSYPYVCPLMCLFSLQFSLYFVWTECH
jgi:hypothetical protein